MNIWTFKEGEPLPIEGCPGRRMRTGIISEMLVERGHNVTWWTSDFFHQTKNRLREKETVIEINGHYKLHMLHAKTVYKKNISLQRAIYSWQLGHEFSIASQKLEKPDVMICSFPLIDIAYEAVRFAKKRKIPIIVDIRDLWPNIIWEHFPNYIQSIVKLFCAPLIKKTKYIIQNSDVIIGVIPKCLDFARSYGRCIKNYDGVYYLAYKEKKLTQLEKDMAKKFWSTQGITENDFVICWIGQISIQRTDFEMIADVIAKNPSYKLVICGDGVSKSYLEEKYKQFNNIIFPGFLNQDCLEVLMQLSKVGVIPIKNTPDFTDTINNKAIEYMAGSLCIATTLKGLLRETVVENQLGFYFENSQDFSKKLNAFYNDKNLLNAYKQNSRKYYEQHFKSDVIYGKLCEIVEILGNKNVKSEGL